MLIQVEGSPEAIRVMRLDVTPILRRRVGLAVRARLAGVDGGAGVLVRLQDVLADVVHVGGAEATEPAAILSRWSRCRLAAVSPAVPLEVLPGECLVVALLAPELFHLLFSLL